MSEVDKESKGMEEAMNNAEATTNEAQEDDYESEAALSSSESSNNEGDSEEEEEEDSLFLDEDPIDDPMEEKVCIYIYIYLQISMPHIEIYLLCSVKTSISKQ